MEDFKQILKKYWGYNNFRELQEEIITSVYNGNDTLALLPTGGGKSITYQVPALAKPGICLVVSPLIALIKDQVENLRKRQIEAEYIISGMTTNEIVNIFDKIEFSKKVKFLYVSPERLQTHLFLQRIVNIKVNLIAVDEAHCISQWGYDFRPSYLKIADIREILKGVPVLAVTATATKEVVDDIQEKLLFRKKNVLKKSFERKNLIYTVKYVDNKLKALIDFITKTPGSGIVYTRSRKKTVEIYNELRHYVSCDFYHAGLSITERNQKQESWKTDKIRIIIATNAFGMGIDKPDVRFVVHFDVPDCLEEYFQEAGRAGRDEKEAIALLLVDKNDRDELVKRYEQSFPSIDFIRTVYHAIGSYLQVPIGSGQHSEHLFDYVKFARHFNYPLLETYNAIKFLVHEGYFDITDDIDNPSRIKFIVNREELYNYQLQNPFDDLFIKVLLRTYAGLFTEYTKISESELSRLIHIPENIVKETLHKLKKQEIIDYIEQKQGTILTYLENRLDKKAIGLSRWYTFLKERAKVRMEEMLNYAYNKNKCRSIILLNYFNEETSYRCGKCDTCTERNELDISSYEFDLIIEEIKSLCTNKSVELNDIINSIKFQDKEKVIKIIRWLLDHGKLTYTKTNMLKWVTR
ncbi:MAG: RecQ family ATP-dependent DNA helicase [Bacteroidales bacterium]|nr:RecQ family ATP-dependent DNA helicase [Bacteroidales bacterium]